MTKEILIWENKATHETRKEEREQISTHLWKSLTDGRYYTKGILGWWDITDNIEFYK